MTTPGRRAPAFSLSDQFGRAVRLEDHRFRCHVLLLFYPLDWTPT
jgi:peroxiredoxin